MPNRSDDRPIIDAERYLLQALCQEASEGSIRETARRVLKDYRWREAIHKIVFDCLIDFPSDVPLAIRDQLPGRVTRKGFPDVPWEEFFQPISISRQEAEDLMQQLCDPSSIED